MATPNTNLVKYKFGEDEFSLQDYIRNLERNYQSYVDALNWNEGLKQEFRIAYEKILGDFKNLLANNTNRFSTNSAGSIIDSTGVLNNTDDDGIDPVGSEYYYDNKGNRITTDDFNSLKKRKQKNYNTFSANRLVAEYFNRIGTALRDARKPASLPSNAFNLAKNGFTASWLNTNNPAGGLFDYTPYWEKDSVDESTGARGTSNRANYLKELIENYINNVGDYDFSGSSFKTRDAYIQALQEAATGLANGYSSEDTIALNRAGISNDFLNNFFATGEKREKKSELELQAEQAAAELAKRQKEDEQKAVIQAEADDRYDREMEDYFNLYIKENPFLSSINGTLPARSYNATTLNNIIAKQRGIDPSNVNAMQLAIFDYINFPELSLVIRGLKKMLRNGKEDVSQNHIANNLDWAYNYGLLKLIGDSGYYLIPNSEDYNRWTYVAYNPFTKKYEELSMLLNEELKKSMAYDHYRKTHPLGKKYGGVIEYQYGGVLSEEAMQYFDDVRQSKESKKEKENRINNLVKELGISREQAEAKERRPAEEGFSTIDKIRLGTIAADALSAAASFVPGYGTAASGVLGIGSTLVNLGADLNDDSLSGWDAAKNAGFGLGMDLVGLIPGWGAAGKAAKVSRVLKPIAKTVATYFAAKGFFNSTEALGKLLSDPSSMNVEDWRNLATGLLAIAGATRYVGGKVARNRELNRTTTSSPYRTIRTASGKNVKMTNELFDRITHAKGLENLNAALREIAPGESLGSEFRNGKWLRIRHPSHRNPETGKGVDYTTNTSWENMEYLPVGYTVKDGKVVPRVLSDAWFAQLGNHGNIEGGYWFRKKNPMYLENLSAQPKPATTLQTPKSDSKSSYLLSRKRFDAAVDKGIKTRDQIRTIEYWKKRYPNRLKGKTDEEILQIILDQLKANKHEKGGVLDLTRVRKFVVGGGVSNTTSSANWFEDMFKALSMQKYLESITADNYEDFNNLLKSWASNRTLTGYTPGQKDVKVGVPEVLLRQLQWDKTGTNLAIWDLLKSGKIKASGNTGDNGVGEYKGDGAFGEQEFLRHGGTKESWAGHEEDLKLFLDMLAKRNLTYTLDEPTGMYLIGLLSPNSELSTVGSENSTGKISALDTLNTSGILGTPNLDTKFNLYSWMKDLSGNPTLLYGLPRAVYADVVNRRMTDIAKLAEVPLLKDPFEIHRYTRSDLDAEMLGWRNYASVRRLARNPLTSDGDLQTAAQFLAESLGLQAINEGREKSNQVLRQYDELAWQLEKENAANRHENAMANRASMLESDKKKSAYEQAYLSKKHNIWDVFGQLLEYDARTKIQENKSRAEALAKSDIHNAVMYSPNYYGSGLTPSELEVWNKVLSGTKVSELSNDEQHLYILASRKVSNAESSLLREYYNIPRTIWSNRTLNTNLGWKPVIARDGAKIAVAGIKARTADAERFQKQIKECIDRNEKTIERLSKGLNKITKLK